METGYQLYGTSWPSVGALPLFFTFRLTLVGQVRALRYLQHMRWRVALLPILFACLAGAPAARAQRPDWTEAFPPFQITGQLYYVGSKGLANYLITTQQGHIL